MSKPLLDCVHFVKAQRAAVPKTLHANAERYFETRDARRDALKKMVETITAELPKVTISERTDMTRVSIAGVRASSTGGIDQALANWVAAAYRKLDSQS